MTVAEAEAMRDAAKRSGCVLMYGLVQRYRTETTVLKEMAAAGKFGDIYFGKATILRRRGTPPRLVHGPGQGGRRAGDRHRRPRDRPYPLLDGQPQARPGERRGLREARRL